MRPAQKWLAFHSHRSACVYGLAEITSAHPRACVWESLISTVLDTAVGDILLKRGAPHALRAWSGDEG